jgi:hypothetical protein
MIVYEAFSYLSSIIIFSYNSCLYFVNTFETKPSVLSKHSSIVAISHCLHDVFLSALFPGWSVVILSVTKGSFIMGGSSEQFLFGLSIVMFSSLFSEEVVSVEDPVSPSES